MWMSLFVAETRKKDGSPFPVSSLNLILAGIKRYMKAQNPMQLISQARLIQNLLDCEVFETTSRGNLGRKGSVLLLSIYSDYQCGRRGKAVEDGDSWH